MKLAYKLVPSVRCGHEVALVLCLLALVVLAGLRELIAPHFAGRAVASNSEDYVNHVALVTAARDTLRDTGAFPISSDAIYAGIEYPYFIFGNIFFYVFSAYLSFLLGVPAYLGAGITVGLAFSLGVFGIYLLASRAGLSPYLSIALGFLYAAGPYLSVDLFQRLAFPEYLALQLMPLLLLTLRWALRPEAGIGAVFLGAVTLALPFYVHKLIAPFVVITLLGLAVSGMPLRRPPILRLMVMGVVAICLSVPAWYPALRGLDTATALRLARGDRPEVHVLSMANLFWPFEQDSLTHLPTASEQYQGRFALQMGLIPTAGFVAAAWRLATAPKLAFAQGLPIPLVMFVVYAMLILDTFAVWDLAPSIFKYVQFSYRVIGPAHFVGFLLLIQALGSLSGKEPSVRAEPRWSFRRALGGALVALAALGAMTYWHPPRLLEHLKAADIKPTDLRDSSGFYTRSVRSTLVTEKVISDDGWLAVPALPIFTDGKDTSIILLATAQPFLFEDTSEPLMVTIYGLEPAAFLDAAAGGQSSSGAAADSQHQLLLPEGSWIVSPLAETTIDHPRWFELGAALIPSVRVLMIGCSRTVTTDPTQHARPEGYPRYIKVGRLVPPNEGNQFVDFEPIPGGRSTRLGLGTTVIDARRLRPGHYLLPTFHYGFLKVTDDSGNSVPTYQYDRRAVIRHRRGVESYTVWYDLRPEIGVVVIGLGIFGAYAVARRMGRTILVRAGRRVRRRGAIPADVDRPPVGEAGARPAGAA